MKQAALVALAILLIVAPYALITLGVYMVTDELGWALVTLGVLSLVSGLVIWMVAKE